MDEYERAAFNAQCERDALQDEREVEIRAARAVDTERRWRDRRRKRIDPGIEVRALARVAGLIK